MGIWTYAQGILKRNHISRILSILKIRFIPLFPRTCYWFHFQKQDTSISFIKSFNTKVRSILYRCRILRRGKKYSLWRSDDVCKVEGLKSNLKNDTSFEFIPNYFSFRLIWGNKFKYDVLIITVRQIFLFQRHSRIGYNRPFNR